MNRTLELVWLAIREYFRHPAEDIRQARPVVPGRLYRNFGYVCKAVRYTADELKIINSEDDELPEAVRLEKARWDSVANQCLLCDFQKKGVPCPYYNQLKNGRTVCDEYRYVILRDVKL